MKKQIIVSALGVLLTVTAAAAQAPGTGRVTPEYPKAGSPAAEATPGATGPGSEKNAVTSPTSRDLPASKQAPPDIPANSGSSTGTSGDTIPKNSDTPSEKPQD